ncbi:DUF1116 domain-containing protein [Thermanaerovibrio acidaminovorans]|jgi:hypothetical protein|uniref:DUF1116 domain-containing protein n=1 Tax=Thermanaerovibrio acidaminovorans (strain ATCC 49978 / DSM 6589 / Su883) TaxID=525903 RepID=D1B8P7_THEAS|nr:DUF1116 domain-containing protein [Thermanaerovibrio acidaminovorans]ACZ18650.1 protein of unknown function DUF1116 [Thermanaerovibrio acidaminovorans DSM 6589]
MVDIDKANQEALSRLLSAQPVLVDMGLAKDVVPGMGERTLLHAGPPITWERMSGPMRGAVMAACLYEGWASTPEEAVELAASGEITFDPCHHHSAVGPMAGVTSPNMPVFVIENKDRGNRAYCSMNEGLGKVMRMGAYDDEVIERLKWMRYTLYPNLHAGVRRAYEVQGGIDIKNIIAQALHMGDEMHNRNKAGTSLFLRAIVPFMIEAAPNCRDLAEVVRFIDKNDHFFLNLAMAAAKASTEAAHDVEGSSLVTIMARNGTEMGIQVSGLGRRWFTCEAALPDVLLFPGFTKDDVNRDIGDSAIMETLGIGGFALAAAPAIVQFIGGTPADAAKYTLEMYEITLGENNVYSIPSLNFRGTPTGIDVLKVAETGITPVLDTGAAHKEPGRGQVGAGIVRMPSEAFIKAAEAFVERYAE